jgi:hypothetical protein
MNLIVLNLTAAMAPFHSETVHPDHRESPLGLELTTPFVCSCRPHYFLHDTWCTIHCGLGCERLEMPVQLLVPKVLQFSTSQDDAGLNQAF